MACISPSKKVQARVIAKSPGVLAGWEYFAEVFRQVDPTVRVDTQIRDGDTLKKGACVSEIQGNGRSVLLAERTALNYLQRASGIATLTRKFVNSVKPLGTVILDTRKTTPGLRHLEKSAVRTGGGQNHRWNLSDGILIKENHIQMAGGIGEALRRVQTQRGKRKEIMVEASSLNEVRIALIEGADWILLDNMPVAMVREVVRRVHGKCVLEVSGGMDLKNVRSYAKTGVDYISVGSLTHSAPALDFSLLID